MLDRMSLKNLFFIFVLFVSFIPYGYSQFRTGNDLYNGCREINKVDNGAEAFANVMCLAFIDGIWGSRFYESCPAPNGATLGQALNVVLKFARDNPQHMQLPAHLVVRKALSQAWPCGGVSTLPVHRGSWYNPNRDGEGFLIDMVYNGNSPTLIAYWYTYDQGQQMWLVGAAPFSNSDTSVQMDMYVTDGPSFGDAFNPADVNRTPWGTVTFSFPSCNSAVVSYSSQMGYGSGTIQLSRIVPTSPLIDDYCSDS